MNRAKIWNIILAVALIVLSAKVIYGAFDESSKFGSRDTAQIVLDNIYSRTSVRYYIDKPIEKEKIDNILKAAMSAPTARNKQPWAFVVITDRQIMDSLAAALPNTKMLADAPLAIAVCGEISKSIEGEGAAFWVQDASAATENILLASHALGLGAVWTGVYPIKEKVATVRSVLKLPGNIVPLSIVPIGYYNNSPKPKDKWKEENIHYNIW